MCIGVSTLPLKNTTPSFLPSPSPPLISKLFKLPSFLGNPPKLTKFLCKISQFEFLVKTGKNIFAYKLFLLLNISDFNLFFMWKLQPPPWKKSPSSKS